MGRKLGLLVAMFVLGLPASALAQDTASTALNILPSGQSEDASAPGATRQAQMYNALTPLRDNITDAQLPNYFKSEALDPGNTIVRTETIPGRPGVEIRRDGYDVPHIYGQTDDDVTFGAGYAIAEDRNLLLNQARFDSLTAAIDSPGPSAIDLVSNLYQFAPSKQTERIVSRQSRVLRKAGPKGVQLLHDIDTYVAGINAWYSANQPDAPPFTRNDIYGLNALKGQYLGQGGGQEPQNSEFLTGLQGRFGSSEGFGVYKDLRGRDDPTNPTTLRKPAVWDPEPASRKGVVGLKNNSFKPSGANLVIATHAVANEASNILVASGSRSSTGHPLFVGGPQISYFFPGLVEEMGLHGPNVDVRGATSAPFPGYMLIGRAEHFAWTLTSADADIIDSYAETLCGGSKLKYEYKGKCLPMQKVDAGTITKGATKVRDVSTGPSTAVSGATRRRRRARRWRSASAARATARTRSTNCSSRTSPTGASTRSRTSPRQRPRRRRPSIRSTPTRPPPACTRRACCRSAPTAPTATWSPAEPGSTSGRATSSRPPTRRARCPTASWSTGTTSPPRGSPHPMSASAMRR